MRIFLGAIVMLAIVLVLGIVLDLHVTASSSATRTHPQPGSAFLGLFAAAWGGFIARKGFVPVALGMYVAFWSMALYHLHKFSPGSTYATLLFINIAAIALSFAGVIGGALLGQFLAGSGKTRDTAN